MATQATRGSGSWLSALLPMLTLLALLSGGLVSAAASGSPADDQRVIEMTVTPVR